MKSHTLCCYFVLLLSAGIVNAQMTFNNNFQVPAGAAGTVTTASNGIILSLEPNQNFGYIGSDPIVGTTTPTDYYVTLICTNTAVDYGFVSGSSSSYTQRLVGTSSQSGGYGDLYSIQYPGAIVGTYTNDPYTPTLGQTLRFTLTKYDGSNYYEIIVRDMAGNYLMNSPINPQGQLTSMYYGVYSTSGVFFAFEVLNCGQAKFCVQTAAQAASNPGNCDQGATTSTSCSSTACTGATWATAGSTFLQARTNIVSSCPAPSVQTSQSYCSSCSSACYTCQAAVTSRCHSCSASSSTPFSYNGQCLADCSTQSLVGYNGRCQKSCPSNTYLSGSQCLDCSSGTYANNGICTACSTSNCATCPGDTCSVCSTSYYFSGSQCVNSCPSTTYALNGICTACSTSNCATCPGNTCSVCSTSYYLSSSQCVNSCPSTTYALNGICTACSTSNCATCPGDTCSVCSTSYYLSGSQCVNSCPSTTYALNGICTACSTSNCATCPSDTCSVCSTSYYLSGSQCVNSCPSGTYANNDICTACSASNCATCPDNTCTVCITDYQLSSGQCYRQKLSISKTSHLKAGIIVAIVLCSTFAAIVGALLIKWLISVKDRRSSFSANTKSKTEVYVARTDIANNEAQVIKIDTGNDPSAL